MPNSIQLVYPMGKIVISTHKVTSQLNNAFKNARHFKPSEYLSYYKLNSWKNQVSAFPLYESEDPTKVYINEYTALFSGISSKSEIVEYSKLCKSEDGACFIVAANYWPVEIHNCPKVSRVPMFFQAEDMTELKLRFITFIADFGHNKQTLNNCKPFLNLVDLSMTNLAKNYEESDDCKLSELPVSIKPILHITCCSVPLLTAEGMLQVSDAPLSTIKQEMESNNLTMVVLDYSSDEGIQLHSERNVRLSECESAPLILKPNEMIFVFVSEFVASRAQKNCFQYKSKKIAYKVSEDLNPKQISKFLNLNLKTFDISEKMLKRSDGKLEVKVKVITTKKNYWKYDVAFYDMMITNALGVQTTISEILALWHYYSNDKLVYAYGLIIFLALTIIVRLMIGYWRKELRWHSLFTSVLGIDRMIEAYARWNKNGNRGAAISREVGQLYLQTLTSLVLTLLSQLQDNEYNGVLLANTFLSSLSVCMALSGVASCFKPMEFDPRKNPWDSPLYPALLEKKYDQNFNWKINQLLQFLIEISSRCLLLSVTLLKWPIAFGVSFYLYFLFETMYSLYNIQSPTMLYILGPFIFAPSKSFISRELVYVSNSQLREMMKKDLLNPEMLIVAKYYHIYLILRIFRAIPNIACIIYLLHDNNFYSETDGRADATTYASLLGFSCTAILLLLYLYDCLILRHFAKIERKKKFTSLNCKSGQAGPHFYKIVPLETLTNSS